MSWVIHKSVSLDYEPSSTLMSLLSRLINAPEEDQSADAMGQEESPLRQIVLQGLGPTGLFWACSVVHQGL